MTCSVGNPGVKGWGTLLILLCSSVAVPVRCASWDSSLNSRVLGVRATASPVLYPVQLNLQPAAQPSAHHLAGWHALAAQQQVANAGGSAGNRGSSNPHDPQYTWHRRRLHESGQQLSADGSERLEAWLQNSTWIRTYQNGSCFPSGRVHQAANVRGEALPSLQVTQAHVCAGMAGARRVPGAYAEVFLQQTGHAAQRHDVLPVLQTARGQCVSHGIMDMPAVILDDVHDSVR